MSSSSAKPAAQAAPSKSTQEDLKARKEKLRAARKAADAKALVEGNSLVSAFKEQCVIGKDSEIKEASSAIVNCKVSNNGYRCLSNGIENASKDVNRFAHKLLVGNRNVFNSEIEEDNKESALAVSYALMHKGLDLKEQQEVAALRLKKAIAAKAAAAEEAAKALPSNQ